MKQVEGNFTKVPNVVMEAIISSPFKATQMKILLNVIRYTYGFNRKSHNISVSFLSKATNISRRYISSELQELIESNILIVSEDYSVRSSRKLSINECVTEWIVYGTRVPQVNHSSTGEPQFNTTGEPQFNTTGEPQFTQERKIKEKYKEKKSNAEEINKVIDLYREKLSHLPQPRKITDERKKHISARVNEYGIEEVINGIEKASESQFLAGNGGKGWKADIDWIFNPTNFSKILEGKYDNRETPKDNKQNWRGSDVMLE